VWRILQDRRGFLWFGAYNGLHRYDGYELKTYTHDPQNSSSISNNSTKAILEDRAGMLWFGTEGGGLDMFDPRTERFVHYRYDANNSQSLSSDRIASLYQDRSVVLWVGTSGGGLNRLVPNDSNVDPGQAIFVRYQYDANDPQSLSNNDNIYSICADPFQPDILWIGTWGCGLNRFDTKTGICRRFQNDPADPHSLSEDKVTRVTADQAGMLWIGTWGGGLNRLLLRAVAGEKANGPAASQFARFKSDPVDPQALTHNNVVSIYEDRTGLLWIGTAGGGVNFYDRDRKAFRHYRHHPLDPNSLSESDIRSVYEDREGGLWVGTQSSGLNQFDRRRQRARSRQHEQSG
jgi:ligand-binding sensor domain-containing protein